jgi:hypothetical protein
MTKTGIATIADRFAANTRNGNPVCDNQSAFSSR